MNTQITQNPNTYQSDARFPQVQDDEIDLRELFSVIWRGKWIILAITAVFAVGAVPIGGVIGAEEPTQSLPPT